MREEEKGMILELRNNWEYKDFAVGLELVSESWNEFREYYLLLSLGFWQVQAGIRVWIKFLFCSKGWNNLIKNLKEFKDAYWSKMGMPKTKRKQYIKYLIKEFPSFSKQWDNELKIKHNAN